MAVSQRNGGRYAAIGGMFSGEFRSRRGARTVQTTGSVRAVRRGF